METATWWGCLKDDQQHLILLHVYEISNAPKIYEINGWSYWDAKYETTVCSLLSDNFDFVHTKN